MKIFYNNKITFRVILIFLIFIFGKTVFSQTAICGKVTDNDTGEDMIAANIVVTKNGVFIQGATTDIDGNYTIQVDSGKYDMEISYTGYRTQKITGIVAIEGKATKVDVQISSGEITDYPIIVCCGCCRVPLIQHDKTTTGRRVNMSEGVFRKLPTRNINEMIMMAPGVTFSN